MTGFPEFIYDSDDKVAAVKFTYNPAWTTDFVKKVVAGYDEAIAVIKPGDSDFAKILKFHDWVVANVSYGMSKSYPDFAVGAFANRSAICAGYTRCYQFLLEQQGIESIYIAAQTQTEAHAWNLVKYEGHYFHVDCTWDRGVGPNPGTNHTYFMLNDDEFNANGKHTEDWKNPSKGYPANNVCSIENKFYQDYKTVVPDEQIVANPIHIRHEFAAGVVYSQSETEHWRTCAAGTQIREQHTGDPCSVCGYQSNTSSGGNTSGGGSTTGSGNTSGGGNPSGGADTTGDQKDDTNAAETPEEPAADPIQNVKEAASQAQAKARASRLDNGKIQIAYQPTAETKAFIEEAKEQGFTVKYRLYRSKNKNSGYRAVATKKTDSFTRKADRQGSGRYYKIQVRVYDENGRLISKTPLKQCRYAVGK